MGASLADPLVGHVVDGRYEVTARIARGGMATVYRAIDRRLDREVALKIMHPHLAEGSDVVARFRREARAAARLTHPGIVGVYDQGSDGDTAYLTLEHVDGPNLRAVLQDQGTLPLGEALDLIEAVLDALAAAHSAGLVHRDVKPENVLINADGRVKVADFGLARAVTEATAATTGTVLGTVAYLSPEIVTAGVADARADVYACGVMLYELLTGEQPLTGETAIQTAYRHVHEDIPPPSTDVPWLPVEVDDAIASMTARDVDDRLHDARAALVLVRRAHLQIDDETLARRADPPERPAPANDGGAMTSALSPAGEDGVTPDAGATQVIGMAASSSTVALPIGAFANARPTSNAAAAPEAPPRRGRWSRLIGVLLTLVVLAVGTWWWLTMGPGAYTTVPDVSGATVEEAEATLATAGLTTTVSEQNDDTVPVGLVVTTEPAPGEPVLKEGDVVIVVSLGILMLEVPETSGMTEAEALAALGEVGFPIGEITRPYDNEIPEGSVVSTSPAAGEIAPHNQPVTVAVSQGREPVTVPSVVGATQATAEAELTARGLVPDVAKDFSDTVPAGSVMAQDPGAGPAFRGDTVTITVSDGPRIIPVPDVVGKQVAEAERILREAGFEVRVERVLGGFFGTVRSSSPAAGDEIARGTTVVITVV